MDGAVTVWRVILALVILLAPSAHATGMCLSYGACGDGPTPSASIVSEPYDLSGFTIAHTVTWPAEPSGMTTYSGAAVDTCAEVDALLDAGSAHVVAPNSDLTGCDLSFAGNDTWLEMSNSSSFDLGGMSGDRIKITGGALNTSLGDTTVSGDDVLSDNVVIDGGGVFIGSGSRLAWINSDLNSGDASLFSQTAGTKTDWILANNYFGGGDEAADSVTVRIQTADRVIAVDNCFAGQANANLRIIGTDNFHVEDNVIDGTRGASHIRVRTNDDYGGGASITSGEILNNTCYSASDSYCVWVYEEGTGSISGVNIGGNTGYGYSSFVGAVLGTPTYTQTPSNAVAAYVSQPDCSDRGADH